MLDSKTGGTNTRTATNTQDIEGLQTGLDTANTNITGVSDDLDSLTDKGCWIFSSGKTV